MPSVCPNIVLPVIIVFTTQQGPQIHALGLTAIIAHIKKTVNVVGMHLGEPPQGEKARAHDTNPPWSPMFTKFMLKREAFHNPLHCLSVLHSVSMHSLSHTHTPSHAITHTNTRTRTHTPLSLYMCRQKGDPTPHHHTPLHSNRYMLLLHSSQIIYFFFVIVVVVVTLKENNKKL